VGAVPAQARDSAGPETLNGQVGRGLAWSFVNNVLARIGNVVAGIVLARLLVPEDYGVFAVALVVLNAGLSMNELGVSLAIIRWERPVAEIAPTVTTLAVAWSLLLYTVCFAGAPVIGSMMGAPDAVTLIRVLSIAIVFDALAAVPAALITRHFQQRLRMTIDLLSFAAGTSLAIVLAFMGYGAWAMVWGFLVSNLASSILAFVWAPRRYRPGFDRSAAKELLTYGLPLAGASMVMFLMLNVDYLIVGRELDTRALGLYLLAFNVCTWPVSLVSVAVRRVSFAGFARVAGGEARRRGMAFARSAAIVLGIAVPLCAALATYAAPLVEVLYGSRWLPAAAVVPALCVLSGVRVVLELAYDFLAAIGRTRWVLSLQTFWLVLLVPALTAGAAWGEIQGVAVAHAAVAVALVVPAFLVALRRCGVPILTLAALSWRPMLAGLLVIGTGKVAQAVLGGPFAELVLGGAVSALCAVVVVLPLRKQGREMARDLHSVGVATALVSTPGGVVAGPDSASRP
jgi:PST family polysaccharide transporter